MDQFVGDATRFPALAKRLRVGVCYYPEQWAESQWHEDATLMRKSGITTVRIGEFVWCRLEPREGDFQFDWLDLAIDILGRAGLDVVLGTPTATPPNWLTTAHPEVLPRDVQGRPFDPGVRGHRCYTSPSYRQYTRQIVGRMAARYGKNPTVIGWQIDNEFMLHRCTCESCAAGFRLWLERRYGTVVEVNRVWGMVVWSGEYSSLAEVQPPHGGSQQLNPSYQLDWYRYENECIADFQREQLELLRAECPGQFVTHNSWSVPVPLDYCSLFAPLDFASLDYYPSTNPDDALAQPYRGAMHLDLTRGYKRQGFWIMEQLSGPPGCWMPMWRTPYPGLIRAFGWQSISRGANTVMFFRWRSGAIGAEQFWHGIIDHSNVPGRRLAEVAQFAGEVGKLSKLLGDTEVEADVALLYRFDQHTAFMLQQQADGLDYYQTLQTYHRALSRLGVGVDCIDWQADMGCYKLLIAPMLYLLDETMSQKLEQYVEQGGRLILTCRSGVKDPNNVCHQLPLPSYLARVTGVHVSEYDPIGKQSHQLAFEDGRKAEAKFWCDLLVADKAEVLASYQDDFYAGTAAITRNHFGKGDAYYLGTHLDDDSTREFLAPLIADLGIESWMNLPEGVQASVRRGPVGRYLFLLNLSRARQNLELPRQYRSLLSGTLVSQNLELLPYDVEILSLNDA